MKTNIDTIREALEMGREFFNGFNCTCDPEVGITCEPCARGLEMHRALAALSTIDLDAGTGWMIEATQELLKIHGLSAPAWWTGIDPSIDEIFSIDPNKGVRFSHKEDAEKVIRGWGYSLENQWVFASDHRWG